jgi:hypothetical protein
VRRVVSLVAVVALMAMIIAFSAGPAMANAKFRSHNGDVELSGGSGSVVLNGSGGGGKKHHHHRHH